MSGLSGGAGACAAVGTQQSSRKRPQALPHLARLLISHKGLLFPCGQAACGDAVMHMSGAHKTSLEPHGERLSRCTIEFPATSLSLTDFCLPSCGTWMPVPRGQGKLWVPCSWSAGGLLQRGWPFSAVCIHTTVEEFSIAYCTLARGLKRIATVKLLGKTETPGGIATVKWEKRRRRGCVERSDIIF